MKQLLFEKIKMIKKMENEITNILICGVGGQGILLAGEVLSEAALRSGFDVKKSEVHGMAQRGGSVVSHVRYGKKIFSPLIKEGDTDFLFSFEKMETLRYLSMLKENGTVIINDQKISPTNISLKTSGYPENVEEICKKYSQSVQLIHAIKIAENLGNIKTVNIIMLGALSKHLFIKDDIWMESLESKVPKKHLEINIQAFNKGRER
jgi:indolepyruvate ferredoxin oxidoreductase beta subunit